MNNHCGIKYVLLIVGATFAVLWFHRQPTPPPPSTPNVFDVDGQVVGSTAQIVWNKTVDDIRGRYPATYHLDRAIKTHEGCSTRLEAFSTAKKIQEPLLRLYEGTDPPHMLHRARTKLCDLDNQLSPHLNIAILSISELPGPNPLSSLRDARPVTQDIISIVDKTLRTTSDIEPGPQCLQDVRHMLQKTTEQLGHEIAEWTAFEAHVDWLQKELSRLGMQKDREYIMKDDSAAMRKLCKKMEL